MSNYDLTPLLLTLKLSSLTACLLFVFGMPLAYWLAYTRFILKPVIEAFVAMPIILPPTVLGFYLLVLLGNTSPLGRWLLATFDVQLVFSFAGLVIGSILYSLPFMIQPLQAGLEAIPREFIESARVMGASRLQTVGRVILPTMRRSVLTGLVLSFAHTVGEFGVIMMIGGNIPGETRVASIAVYDEVQAMNYSAANFYAIVLLLVSFLILLLVYSTNRRFFR